MVANIELSTFTFLCVKSRGRHALCIKAAANIMGFSSRPLLHATKVELKRTKKKPPPPACPQCPLPHHHLPMQIPSSIRRMPSPPPFTQRAPQAAVLGAGPGRLCGMGASVSIRIGIRIGKRGQRWNDIRFLVVPTGRFAAAQQHLNLHDFAARDGQAHMIDGASERVLDLECEKHTQVWPTRWAWAWPRPCMRL